MALYLVLLSTILAFSLTSTEQYVLSPRSNIDLSLHTVKNASRNWNITLDIGRNILKENPRPLLGNVHQEATNTSEQLVSVAFAHPSLHDTSMSGAVQPTAASTSTTTAATPSCTTTNTTTTPKSCPQSGYQLYPEFNCYKAFPSFDERRSWSDAREQCMRDGGDLMVMETERERKEVYIPLYNSVKFSSGAWLGVYIPQGGDSWITVKGQPALSTWWAPGFPKKDAAHTCAMPDSTGLLRNFNCAAAQNFICEISL